MVLPERVKILGGWDVFYDLVLNWGLIQMLNVQHRAELLGVTVTLLASLDLLQLQGD